MLRSEGPIWKQIRYACVYDPVKSANFLNALNLIPVDGCMNLLRDRNGIYYAIPNFCINDSYLEKKIEKLNDKRKTESLTVCIKLNFNIKINYLYMSS